MLLAEIDDHLEGPRQLCRRFFRRAAGLPEGIRQQDEIRRSHGRQQGIAVLKVLIRRIVRNPASMTDRSQRYSLVAAGVE